MDLNIDPISDWLIVRPLDDEQLSGGGLHIPFDTERGPKYATVLAAGPGQLLASGEIAPMPCKVGDTVLLQINAGSEVRLGRETYRFVQARDLFGIVMGDTKRPEHRASNQNINFL